MTFGTLHAWHVAMRGLLLSPSPDVLFAAAVVVCFEGKYSAVAGLVHAFGSWQRCV